MNSNQKDAPSINKKDVQSPPAASTPQQRSAKKILQIAAMYCFAVQVADKKMENPDLDLSILGAIIGS